MSPTRQPIPYPRPSPPRQTILTSKSGYFPPQTPHTRPPPPLTPYNTPSATRPDSQFTTIGTLLSSPYDSGESDSDSDEIQTPPAHPRASLSPVKHPSNTSPRKPVLDPRIQSLEGVMEEDEPYSPISYPQPTKAGLITPSRSPYSPPIRTPPSNTQTIIQTRPIITITTLFSPHSLPPPSSPISPYLANPQLPLTLPNSPFSKPTSDSRSSISSTSDSIRGLDVLVEKKALFRGGEEELMSPFSPRGGAKRQESGLRNGVRGVGWGVSGMDFWKRFSVSVRLDEASKADGKDSEWLAQNRDGNKKIKYGIIISFILALCIGGGLAAYFVIQNQHPDSVNPDSVITPSKSL